MTPAKPRTNCFSVVFLFTWSAFAFAFVIAAIVHGEFRWGNRGHDGPLIRPDSYPYFYWGVLIFWLAAAVFVAWRGILEWRSYASHRKTKK